MGAKVHFSKNIIDQLGTTDYWLSLNPDLTLTDQPFLKPAPSLNTQGVDTDRYVQQMKEEGTFSLDGVLPAADMQRMAKAVENVMAAGYPPVFAYVYDEFWQVFRNLSPLLVPVFGEKYRLITNFWAWYIPATNEDAGFVPHRDYSVGVPTVCADGMPEMATVWIPLRDVSTLNSCMYVLPSNRDPNVPDHLEKWDVPQESVQYIRGLPGKAGSIMSWNSQVMHWGSASSKWADGPRISIAAYLKRAVQQGFTSIGLEPLQPVSLDFRLGVIGMVMDHYDKAAIAPANFPPQLIQFCKKYLHSETHEKKFQVEAEAAMKPMPATAVKPGRNDPCPCGSGKKYKRCCGG